MKRLPKLSDKRSGVELPEDLILNILHRLPSKSLGRSKCVSKGWRKLIADSSLDYSCRSRRWKPQPNLIGFFYRSRENTKNSQIRFFFSSEESASLVNNSDGTSVDESFRFRGRRVYIVASSNGFLLCNDHKRRHSVYYVYNPACTRQHLALPKTQVAMEDPGVGFTCKVDDPDKDVVSFTIVRYAVPRNWDDFQGTVTVESFSSETNVWTLNNLILDVPVTLTEEKNSAGVIDGVFCWLEGCGRQVNVYDSVYKCFWTLTTPQEVLELDYNVVGFLGLSGGAFYFAADFGEGINVWKLESNIRSRDAVWVRKYAANVVAAVQQCSEAFGFAGDTLRVEAFERTCSLRIRAENPAIHPALPNVFYFEVRGKVISYDFETNTAQLVYDFGEPWWRTQHYKLLPYEWHQWPRLL